MSLGAAIGYVGHLAISQTTTTLVLMNLLNSGISILAGSVLVGQGVYFAGRLIYQVIESTSGLVIRKINDLKATREITHSTVSIGDEDFELLDYNDEEIIEIDIKNLNAELFNQLDSRKLYRFIGNK